MSPTKPTAPAIDWKELVPSARIDLFEGLTEELEALIGRTADHAAGAAIHGGRMAGEVLTFADEERARVVWVLVGLKPDGRNCEDCLALHGREMSMAEFLDLKFTTRCNGNCRCDKVDAGEEGGDGTGRTFPEPLTQEEIQAALEA